MSRITKIANLEEVLVLNRRYNNAISSKFFTEQNQTRAKISKQLISGILNREISEREMLTIEGIDQNIMYESAKEIKSAVNLIVTLVKNFLSQQELSRHEKKQISRDAFRTLTGIGYRNKARLPMAALYVYFRAGMILFI
jgi:hypothetical protein